MRPFEILIPVLLAIRFAWSLFTPRRPRWLQWLPAIALGLCLLHLVVEGYRWQMIPIYLLVLVSFLVSLPGLLQSDTRSGSRGAGSIIANLIGLILLVAAAALPWLFPVPELPNPTGPYPIGTLNLYLSDSSRNELYAPEPGGAREIMVQIWYPAEDVTNQPRTPWIDHLQIMGPAIAQWIDLPAFFLDHVGYARTHAVSEPAAASDSPTFPLLLFSHGWGGFAQQNTYQFEELVSHGYIVAAIQHTYGAIATVFPDGRIAYINPQALPDGAPEQEFVPAARQLVDQWASDLSYVLDTLEMLNNEPQSPLAGHLDLKKVGAFGHSNGGGTAIEFCGRDARCLTIMGLDAYLTPVSQVVLEGGLKQPALFLFSEYWPSERNDRLFSQLSTSSGSNLQAYTILETDHYDFTVLPMLSPLAAQMGLKGPLDGERVLRIVNDYSLAFFNQTLKGIPSDLISGENPSYPEVINK